MVPTILTIAFMYFMFKSLRSFGASTGGGTSGSAGQKKKKSGGLFGGGSLFGGMTESPARLFNKEDVKTKFAFVDDFFEILIHE